MSVLSLFLEKCKRFLFPPVCVLCGNALSEGTGPLCRTCREAYLRERDVLCPLCGKKAAFCTCPVAHLTDEVFPGVCAAVSRFYNAEHSSETAAMTRSLILRCKREGRRDIAKTLAHDLAVRVGGILFANGEDTRTWTVTYIPRNPDNLLQYGVDQGEAIARAIADELRCPCVPTLLRVSHITNHLQKELSADARYDNAEAGLAPRRQSVVSGGRYILVDDILTTGATMSVAKKLLLQCGAAAVLPAAAARTMGRARALHKK